MASDSDRIQTLELHVAELERKLAWVMQRLNLHYTDGSPFSDVEELLRGNDPIGAIKAYRTQTGAGLREAKEAVEAMQAAMKAGVPPTPGKPYR